MNRYYYSDTIENFINSSSEEILGKIVLHSQNDELTQKEAWIYQIEELKKILHGFSGMIFFEYAIPRMGRRIDVLLIIKGVLFIIEFKVNEKSHNINAIEQVWDYALDLKNFHETSHDVFIAPILVTTHAKSTTFKISCHFDKVTEPIKANTDTLKVVISELLLYAKDEPDIPIDWFTGRYAPTPTIIEAAMALYNNHNVDDITRSDADAINIGVTSNTLSNIIKDAQTNKYKAICFVTGVPGAGKTLVGLNVATKHMDKENKSTSVYLSGNGPLVDILREALTRDKVCREKEKGKKITKGEVLREVKLVIQNVHNFRDEYVKDKEKPPFDHVAIFDEAQRAWNKEKTADFMKRRKRIPNFDHSEPEFLISCMDRHKDWAVIICLVGGGQEIHTGEAGISEWINTINNKYPEWKVFVSDKLNDSEYAAGKALDLLKNHKYFEYKKELHLAVSLRSFRAENLSTLVKHLLDINIEEARFHYNKLKDNYPIFLTRDLLKAKKWLKERARGSERYGLVVSSQAERLKPYAIDVKTPINPINWFLDGKDDVRSSFYLEDVATEFHVQGLELDWTCVTWDGDFRFSNDGWSHYSFKGNKWFNILKEERKQYLKNAYRVLLTRARQGMIIVIPEGNIEDHTRKPEYYDETFEYVKAIGITII